MAVGYCRLGSGASCARAGRRRCRVRHARATAHARPVPAEEDDDVAMSDITNASRIAGRAEPSANVT
jgi:hypothetical protein